MRSCLLTLWAAVATACGDPTASSAIYENTVDTVTMYALTGTAVALPSGFDVVSDLVARTDQAAFDFIVDMDPAGRPSVYPPRTLGIASPAGLLTADGLFDSVAAAPEIAFDSLAVLPVVVGSVFIVRSRLTSCTDGSELPLYGKFGVLSVDTAIRSVTLQTLINLNCGFRALLPGYPLN